ncbi:MAG: hypothetical protein NTZ83_04810, partial [Candidatus Pacearchaeota archaeon]|nr:hypothetical protein [Candidatus Pacearchaeota archaeon]
MNKKILNTILGISMLVLLIVSIGADGNLTDSNNSNSEENSPNDTLELPLDSQTNLENNLSENIYYESLDSLNENNISNLSTNVDNPLINDSLPLVTDIDEEEENNPETAPVESPLPQERPDSGSGSSNSGDNSEQDVYYIDSTDLNFNNITQNNTQESSDNINTSPKENTEYTSLQIQGKREIDIGSYNGTDITKREVGKNEFEKEVIVSSEEHFEGYLRVYTSLTQESEKENIKIYWENEGNLEITSNNEFSVEYYDEDENGLIDRVSWIVPHLSEQIFRVIIEFGKANESEGEILLNVTGPPLQTRNPVRFNVNVSYNGTVNCLLNINGNDITPLFNESKEYEFNLANGNYNWSIACFDTSNGYYNATFGNFSVNEGFSVNLTGGDLSSTGARMYFLDIVKNDLKSNGTINIHSENPSNIKIELKKDNITHYTQNIPGNITDYLLALNKNILNQSGIYNLTVYFDKPSAKNVTSILFYVASANLTFNTTQIQEGQSVKITVNINSPVQIISYVLLDYGNGTVNYQSLSTNLFNKDFLGKYTLDGQYTVKLNTVVGGISFEIQKNGIVVTDVPSGKDDDSPSITLLEPEDKEIIYETGVNFSYKASDNVKIQNCTFKLYNADCTSSWNCDSSESDLIFPTSTQQRAIANNFSVQNSKRVEIKLEDFEDGTYEWLIECYDNSSNYDWEMGFFKIQANETSSDSLE